MTVAERTREAVRARPFLHDALAAGVVNYAAAAATLEVDAGQEAVTAALRRYAEELSPPGDAGEARARLHRDLVVVGADESGDTTAASEGNDGSPDDTTVSEGNDGSLDDTTVASDDTPEPLLVVGGRRLVDAAATGQRRGDLAAVLATGDVAPSAVERVVGRLRTADIDLVAAAVTTDALLVAVPRRAGADALRVVEGVFE
ncbi:hypothetical protein RYH80_13480 [Halobaculum sp. MBLA0147]|uniref:DUF7523 family protein n=1 Tax=Halobaculum sp. MBLA0147 TaxID=3079934 RepID=UPI003526BCE4